MATVIAGDRKVEFGKLAPNTFKLPPNAFKLPPSTFTLPPDTFKMPPNTFKPPPNTFMLPANTNYFLPLQRSSTAESTASPFENLVESI